MLKEVASMLEEKGYMIYPASFRSIKDGVDLFVAKKEGQKFVGLAQKDESVKLSSPVLTDSNVSLYPLTWDNYQVLKSLIPISPTPCEKPASFGTGDRLGLVTAAHLSVDRNYPVHPVIAQQSPRELTRTNRTFKSVLLDAVMGVLEVGWAGNFGADADHIKDEQYLIEGAEAGYSMYTLDVSDWLQDISSLSDEHLSDASKAIISDYADQNIALPGGGTYTFPRAEILKSALIYEKSMDQVKHFRDVIKSRLADFDLEVSIDEGSRDTTPEDHLFVTEYLHRTGVTFTSIAPKFPGEFQKAVDYMGDVDALRHSLTVHSAIAEKMGGYKLSLHSGSDKFSIYPMYAEITGGHFHIKTSGTSWLMAVKLVCSANPALFAEMYKLCLDNLGESKKAYHVYITRGLFPDALPADAMEFFNKPDVRQLFHISYGVLLDKAGKEIFETLKANEQEHYTYVEHHINDHLKLV